MRCVVVRLHEDEHHKTGHIWCISKWEFGFVPDEHSPRRDRAPQKRGFRRQQASQEPPRHHNQYSFPARQCQLRRDVLLWATQGISAVQAVTRVKPDQNIQGWTKPNQMIKIIWKPAFNLQHRDPSQDDTAQRPEG